MVSAVSSGVAKGREAGHRGFFDRAAPFGFGEIKFFRRQGLIGRAAARLIDRLFARLIIIGDLREAFVGRLFGQRLDGDRACRDIIEQRVHALMEERQPMLHAGVAAAFAHGFVEHVVGRRSPERRDVAGAEHADGVGGELELGHRHQIERAQIGISALAFRIETADRFKRVAEKIEPHRRIHAGREQVDDAAAHRVIAGLAHRRGAVETVEIEPGGDARHRQHIAGRGRERLLAKKLARRHPLQSGIDGGEKDGRMLPACDTCEPRQRHHALRHDRGMRRHPVVRQAIPGREFQDLDIGREKAQRPRERRHFRAVAAHHRDADGRRLLARRDGAGEIGENEAFGAVGNAGQRQRPARREPRRR